MLLNQDLIKKQNLSIDEVEKLEELHRRMQTLKKLPLESIHDIKKYVTTIRDLEFEMQTVWHFTKDTNYHIHWFLDPKCSCPKIDNIELQGIDSRVIDTKCPLHGDLK